MTRQDILALINERVAAILGEREAVAREEDGRIQSFIFGPRSSAEDFASHVALDVLDGGSDRGQVLQGRQNAHGIVEYVRRAILGDHAVGDKLAHQRNQNGGVGIAEVVAPAASEHIKPSKFRAVFCDEDGRLYRIDPATGQYCELPSMLTPPPTKREPVA